MNIDSVKGGIMTDRTRVLIIDNDPHYAQANSVFLDVYGYDVQTASTGALGLRMVEEGKPDIVVVDVMMDDADEGFSIARTISLELDNHVPVIMLNSMEKATGYSFKLEDHPDYFPVARLLDKPLSPGALAENIREVLLKGYDSDTQSS
ncbi:MAG: response regulator [Candidatus Sabulitectum sp.]|nr:response regulator [Candidatus Sabulitectum sp.]